MNQLVDSILNELAVLCDGDTATMQVAHKHVSKEVERLLAAYPSSDAGRPSGQPANHV